MMDYFGLVSQLRQCAIWRWHTDGELTQSGREKPPRFVAVIDDPKRWEILVKRVEGIEAAQKRTKWPVQLFPEVWGWGKVSVSEAVSSRRLQVGQSYVIVDKKATRERAETVAALLKAEGHDAYVEQTEEGKFALEVCAKQTGLSARWGYLWTRLHPAGVGHKRQPATP